MNQPQHVLQYVTRKIYACKFILLLAIFFIAVTNFTAQGQSMGISSISITPDASSILELRTTSKGLLTPRLTTTQRDAITTPATGLIIYNTSTNQFNFYNGTIWTVLATGSSAVNSITGTTNRISIGGTSTDPTIDISSGYVGQSSITTLGTIGTGIWNGTSIAIANGGTGQATAYAAFNALSPVTTLGDLIYGSGTNTNTRLAGNITSTKKFLTQTGNGSVSAAPVWGTISNSDVGLGNVENTALSTWAGSTNITTLGTIATGTWNATSIAIANGGTGQTSSSAAFNALSPVTTLGDIIYGSGTNTNARLAGNITSTKKFLTQTGNGSISAAPSWGTLSSSDVGLGNVENTALSTWVGSANITTLGTIGTGTWNGSLINPAYGGTGVNNGTKTITLGGNLTTSGAFATTLTSTGATNITLPTSGTLTTTSNDLSVFASTTSSQLAGVLSDETGTGSVVLSTSPTLTTPILGTATGTSLATTGAITSSGTAGIGYATGAGGTVTQATNKSTGVTLNKITGRITMNVAALAAGTIVSFTLTNSTIAATDVIIVNHASGGTVGAYLINVQAGSGTAVINVRNTTGGSLSEAIVISFVVIKAVTS